VIKGKFNMKGISKEISFPCKSIAREGGYLFTGECKINRLDFNIGTSSTFLSDNLVLNISVFAKKG
jgi:polyisoprenoid-binding protein YceI